MFISQKFTLRKSTGVKNTLRQNLSLHRFSQTTSEKVKVSDSNLKIAIAGAPPTISTSSSSMCASCLNLNQPSLPELKSDSPRLSPYIFFFQQHMGDDEGLQYQFRQRRELTLHFFKKK